MKQTTFGQILIMFLYLIVFTVLTGCDTNHVAAVRDYRPDIAVITAVSMIHESVEHESVEQDARTVDTSNINKVKNTYKINFIDWQPLLKIQKDNKGKPTWVHFVSQNCPPCRALERGAFKNKQLIKETRNINCVTVTVPSDTSIIWGVRATPTDIWVSKDWKIIGRQNPPDSDHFLSYFRNWERKLHVK